MNRLSGRLSLPPFSGAFCAIMLTPGAYTEKRRADFSKFLFVLIQIDIKMMKKGI
jgi:hypothetical protein